MKKRVISAVIALAIAIPLYLVGGVFYQAGIALLAALAFKETLNLKDSHHPYPLLMVILGFVAVELFVLLNTKKTYIYTGESFALLTGSFLALLIPSIFYKDEKYTTRDAFYLFGTVALIGIFFNLLITLRVAEKWILVYLFLITIMTDTFAYVVGSLIGKHKILPRVSPKKSVEGCICGSIAGTAIASLFYYHVITSDINVLVLILMTFGLTVLGQLGDFFFSKIKRENGIKDFSNLMPGHGGVLDRLDSISFVVFGYILIITIIVMVK